MSYLVGCGKTFETPEQVLEHRRDYGHEYVGIVHDECEGEEGLNDVR